MIVTVPMTLRHSGEMWLTFRRICDKHPVKDINLLLYECEPLEITEDILLLISDTPYPGDTARALTSTVRFHKPHRVVTQFRAAHPRAPLKVLFVVKKWLAEQSDPRTLHLLIVPASSVQGEYTTPAEAIRHFLLHYVVEESGAVLYTRDLWALWASLNLGSTPEDEEIAGIKRVSVYRHLRPLFPGFPPSTVERIGPETHRYWEGYSLRDGPMIPSCPVGCSCSAR